MEAQVQTPVKTKKMSKVDFVRLIMQDPRQTQYFRSLEALHSKAISKELRLSQECDEATREQAFRLRLANLYKDKIKPQESLITKVCNIRVVEGKLSYFVTEPVAYGLTLEEKREILTSAPKEEEAQIIELIQNKKHKLFRVWSKIPLKYRGQEDSDAFLKWVFSKIIVNPVIAQLYLAEQTSTFKRY